MIEVFAGGDKYFHVDFAMQGSVTEHSQFVKNNS